MFSGRIEVTLNTVVCLIKVDCININVGINNTMERVIGGEDNSMLTHHIAHLYKQFDAIRLGSSEMLCLSTVNMEDISISHVLKILSRELLNQENPGADNNNVSGNIDLKTLHSIHDCNQSLTTTSGDNDLTQCRLTHSIKGSLLVWTESDHQLCACNIEDFWRLLTLLDWKSCF